MSVIPALHRWRQETLESGPHSEFEDILGCAVRPCIKKRVTYISIKIYFHPQAEKGTGDLRVFPPAPSKVRPPGGQQ
jgi:hypothetical protein